jgi:hypothetical protein
MTTGSDSAFSGDETTETSEPHGQTASTTVYVVTSGEAGEFGEHWFVRVTVMVTSLQFCGGHRPSESVDELQKSVNESSTVTVLS